VEKKGGNYVEMPDEVWASGSATALESYGDLKYQLYFHNSLTRNKDSMNADEVTLSIQARVQRTSDGMVLATIRHRDPVEFGPLEMETDLPYLRRWFEGDYGKFWGLGGLSRQKLEAVLEEKSRAKGGRLWIGRHLPSRRPLYIHMTYDPFTDAVGNYFSVLDGDIGAHSFVAPYMDRLGYKANELLYFSDAVTFIDSSINRILREPDIENFAIIRRRLQLGYHLEKVIYLPNKTAQVITLTRSSFANVDISNLPPTPALRFWTNKVFFHRLRRFVKKRIAAAAMGKA
jgi:hypothetical protein